MTSEFHTLRSRIINVKEYSIHPEKIILLAVNSIILVMELWLFVALINSLSITDTPDRFDDIEFYGSLLCAFSIVFIIINYRFKNSPYCKTKYSAGLFAMLVLIFVACYSAYGYIINFTAKISAPKTVACSLAGAAIKHAALNGKDISFPSSDADTVINLEEYKLTLLFLPLATCMRDNLFQYVSRNHVLKEYLEEYFSFEIDKHIESYFKLKSRFSEIHKGFVEVAKHGRNFQFLGRSKFYEIVKKNGISPIYFDEAFAKVSGNKAMNLTEKELFEMVVNSRTFKITLNVRDTYLKYETGRNELKKQIANSRASEWEKHFKENDYYFFKFLRNHELSVKLMIAPLILFISTISLVFTLINILKIVMHLEITAESIGQRFRPERFFKYPFAVSLVAVSIFLFIPAPASSSINIFESNGNNYSNKSLIYLFTNIMNWQLIIYSCAKQMFFLADIHPKVNLSSQSLDEKKIRSYMHKASSNKRFTTPISNSLIWFADVLVHHDKLTSQDRDLLNQKLSYYDTVQSTKPGIDEKKEMVSEWKEQYL